MPIIIIIISFPLLHVMLNPELGLTEFESRILSAHQQVFFYALCMLTSAVVKLERKK